MEFACSYELFERGKIMIKKAELLEKQKELGLPLSTLEKDYILSLLLWGISQHSFLSEEWIFKGGTCLKKCYFGDYRFSEDLDFTLKQEASIEVNYIKEKLFSCFDTIYENFPVRFPKEDVIITPFPDKNGQVLQIKIPYQGPIQTSGSLPKVKLDITKEETLIDCPVKMPLIHEYSDKDECFAEINCYSLYEIFSEKLRALVQRTRPRDLYDVVHLGEFFQKSSLDTNTFMKLAKSKFEVKTLQFPSSLSQLPENSLEDLKNDWEAMLAHQLRNIETSEIYLKEFKKLVSWLKSQNL